MAEHTFISYANSIVGAGAPLPAWNNPASNLEGRSFTLTQAQVDATTVMTINDTDGDGMFDDQNTTSGQTYDPGELMVSFDGNTGAPYAGADWNTYAKYTVTGSDGSTFSVSLIARGDPTFDGRAALNPDGTMGNDADEYYYVFDQPLVAGVTYTYSTWDHRGQVPWSSLVVPCFTRGTMIETLEGPVAIESLSVGDPLLTLDHGVQKIRWIGSKKLTAADLKEYPKMRPICIRRDALGLGWPKRDLTVSPQHRMMVNSPIAKRMFGADEMLVAAKDLVRFDGVDVIDPEDGVEYFHILLDRHEVVKANGAWTETLFTGPQALGALHGDALREIFQLFPELQTRVSAPVPARPILDGKRRHNLFGRHQKNHKPLFANGAH